MRRLLIFYALASLMGLMVGIFVGGVMGKPWWYVGSISLAGGIAIGAAMTRRQ